MKILVTGAGGQVGRCFAELAPQYPHWQFIFADSALLDISDRKAVMAFFKQNQPDYCINCAAYTAVDKAESEPEKARAINVKGARNLAEAMARLRSEGFETPRYGDGDGNGGLIHLSTDYVYHGKQNTPFVESDAVAPRSVYARTKLAGERAALRAFAHTMVIRTSWVYASHGNNFVRTMLRLGAERPALRVVFDQIGTPTYAPDLAAAILQIIAQCSTDPEKHKAMSGIWHYSNEGVCSWYDFAKAIFEIKNIPCAVSPITSAEYPTPAQRPPFSVLNKNKIKAAFGLEIPHWREGLERCLERL